MSSIPVALVGLGRMGAGYPSVGGVPRNHLEAILATPGLSLAALVDPDPAARARAHHVAGGRVRLLATAEDLDPGATRVIVDATPGPDRRSILANAERIGATVVLLEKPAATDLPAAEALADAASGLTVRVNVHRRFDARHAAMKPAPRPDLVIGAYGRGLLNYGSHLVDLILDWVGPVEEVRAHAADPGGPDPTIGFDVRFRDGGKASLHALPDPGWDVFEVSFLGAFGRIDLHNGGAHMTQDRPVADAVYAGYTHLVRSHDSVAPVSGLVELYASIRDHVRDGVPLPGTTLADAFDAMAVIEAVRLSARTGCGWQRPDHLALNRETTWHRHSH